MVCCGTPQKAGHNTSESIKHQLLFIDISPWPRLPHRPHGRRAEVYSVAPTRIGGPSLPFSSLLFSSRPLPSQSQTLLRTHLSGVRRIQILCSLLTEFMNALSTTKLGHRLGSNSLCIFILFFTSRTPSSLSQSACFRKSYCTDSSL